MGGGTKTVTTNTSQKTDPWAPAQPALQGILSAATNAYTSGAGQGVYTGQRVAGLGDTTQAGLSAMASGASQGTGVANGANSYVTGLLGSGGSTAGTQGAASAYQSIGRVDTSPTAGLLGQIADPNGTGAQTAAKLASGGYNLDTAGGYQGLLGGLSGQSQTQKSLQDVADGKYLSGSNPYLADIVQRSGDLAASKVAQSFAASGRYGSGMFSNAAADAVSANANNLLSQEYDAERTRQAQAAQAIDSASNTRTSLAQGLLGSIGSTEAQNAALAAQGAQLGQAQTGQALTAASQLAGQQATNAGLDATAASGLAGIASGDRAAALAGVGAGSTVQGLLTNPGQTLTQVGGMQDAARQDQINADMTQFSQQNNAPWQGLGLYSSVVDPIAGMGSSSVGTSVQQVPQPSLFQQALGGLTSGIGLLGKTGAFPSAGSAGGAGWLSALFA
ncbi:hypothetical protein [Methylobacterium sp. JK268]